MLKLSKRQIVIYGLWVFPLLLWWDACLRPISEPDLFFYFALVKTYLRDGVWPTIDPFIYSLPSEPLTSLHQWLGYWLYYLPYSWIGWTGPILVKTVVVAAVFLIPLIPFWARRREIPFYFPLIWSLSIFTAHHRFRERVSEFGDLFTVFLVAGLLWWAETVWFWLVLPFMFLLWAQMHPSYPLGWVILLVFLLLKKPRTWSRAMLISTALCLLAPFLNPEGIDGALYPLYFARDIAPYLRQYVVEWLPLTDSRLYVFKFLYIPLFTIIPWILYRFLRARRRVSFFEWFIFILTIALNFQSVRFGLMAQGLYLCLLTNRELELARWRPGRYLIVYCLIVTFGVFALKYGNSTNRIISFEQRFDIDKTYFPEAATTALDEFKPKLHVFNSFGFGGYLAFRWLGHPPIFFHGFSTNFKFFEANYNKPQESQAELDKLIEKFDIGVFFLSKLGNDNGFINILQKHPGWQKLREDMASVIYVKRDPRVFAP